MVSQEGMSENMLLHGMGIPRYLMINNYYNRLLFGDRDRELIL